MNSNELISLIHSDVVCVPFEDWSAIHVSGDDAESYLHNITTNEIRALRPGDGNHQAILLKKSQVLTDFYCYRLPGGFLLLCEANQTKVLSELLDTLHFAEDVNFELLDQDMIQIHGTTAPQLIDSLFPLCDRNIHAKKLGIHELDGQLVIGLPITGEPGYLIVSDNIEIPSTVETIENHTLWQDTRNRLATDAGFLIKDLDFDESNLVMELGLGGELVSTSKGCYPGQEVVAKIVSRGKVPRKLAPIVLNESPITDPGNLELRLENKKIGFLRRCYYSPALEKLVGLAYIKSDLADDQKNVDFDSEMGPISGTITRLPIYLSPHYVDQRNEFYNQGMQAYHQGDFETAEASFKRALQLDRHHADSWEALAMSVEKRGNIDEALRMNMRYAEADPMAVMAHTNMSRLYMLKGFKDKAEEEQGKAALIEFKLKAKEGGDVKEAQKELEEQQRQQQKLELERKAGIFKQVLEMDAEDEIANFGMGKLLLEQDQSKQAIEHLEKVVSVNPDYSMAWQLLGNAYIKIGDLAKAKEILTSGLKVAEKRGDMMPAKAIRQMLSLL